MNQRVILLTGATGFIGGATLAQLLQAGPPARVLLLVRADSQAAGRARIERSVSRFVGLDEIAGTLAACEIITGDLTDRRAFDNPVFDEVTHVVHLAANTSFVSVRSVRHTNILGALTLAHRMRRAPRLLRFLYVGTAYICGTNAPRVVVEDDYPRLATRHPVAYTESKAECELLLENTASDLPLIVARPSIVIGHTQLGCLPSASLFWFYRCVDMLGRINCSPSLLNDVIPVDYTARALLFLLQKRELQYRRYHVSAGEDGSVSWNQIAAAFAECRSETAAQPYRQVAFETIASEPERLRRIFGPGDLPHLIDALRLYYRFCDSTVEVFDNRRLRAEGMPPPPRFTDYLRQCATLPPNRSVYEQMLDDE